MLKETSCSHKWLLGKACGNGISTVLPAMGDTVSVKSQKKLLRIATEIRSLRTKSCCKSSDLISTFENLKRKTCAPSKTEDARRISLPRFRVRKRTITLGCRSVTPAVGGEEEEQRNMDRIRRTSWQRSDGIQNTFPRRDAWRRTPSISTISQRRD